MGTRTRREFWALGLLYRGLCGLAATQNPATEVTGLPGNGPYIKEGGALRSCQKAHVSDLSQDATGPLGSEGSSIQSVGIRSRLLYLSWTS